MGVHEKVYLVEDSEEVREVVKTVLEIEGHEVIAEATSMQTGLNGIGEAIENGMTVAVIDGDLKSGRPGITDGAEMADAIRKQAPETVIVSFSGQEAANYGDIKVLKTDRGLRELRQAVTAIPRK